VSSSDSPRAAPIRRNNDFSINSNPLDLPVRTPR
jgi:hypothetical protein